MEASPQVVIWLCGSRFNGILYSTSVIFSITNKMGASRKGEIPTIVKKTLSRYLDMMTTGVDCDKGPAQAPKVSADRISPTTPFRASKLRKKLHHNALIPPCGMLNDTL